ncbi:MAG: hypothetical protein CR971_00895 [candidate division SR1 bacterium]|nr:MAG: hypothetical protein CR971_00895 [candidate division SR1 bacterium]
MGNESDLILQSYAKDTKNNYEMQDYTIKYHEGNFICGDDVYVFLKIENDIVIEYSFSGNTSLVSKASASFLHDIIVNTSIDAVLELGPEIFAEHKLQVSARRKNALHLPLLALRNAVHEYKNDGEMEEFEDLED